MGLSLALTSASMAASTDDDLLTQGSSHRFWVARIEMATVNGQSVPQTTFYLRGPGDSTLQRFCQINGRAVALAHRGAQLAALLANGDWILASDAGGTSEGPALPESAHIIALVGGDDSFRALGLNAVSRATTAPTTATTQFVGRELQIAYFSLDNGTWKPMGSLPLEVLVGRSPPTLAICDRIPTVAFLNGDRSVRLLRFDGSTWKPQTIAFQSAAPAVSCQLLSGMEVPVLWIRRDKNADSLEFLPPNNPIRHVPLSFLPAAAQSVSVAYALGQIRVLWLVGDALSEQDLDPADGSPVGGVTAVDLPAELPYLNIARAVEYVIWSALFLAIIGAMRWRRIMQGMVFDLEKIRLAPLPRRFSAGLIDLFPVIIAMAVLEKPNLSVKATEIISLLGSGFYLLHTTIGEMLFDKSLGKWLLGLSVVALDGEPATRSALLIRNLLRVIDLGLVFVPLIVVLVSPLRQRTGDVAAGTLVVQAMEKT
jgi:uncharacterized RDD family membrane protein YckC